MLTILIGFGVAVLFIFIGIRIELKSNDSSGASSYISILCIIFGICVFGLCLIDGIQGTKNLGPFQDYKTTPIYSLSNSLTSEGDGLIFVSISSSNAYTYRTKSDEQINGQEAYKVHTLSGCEILEVEETNCTEPRLVKQRAYYEKNIWQFGKGHKDRYVFYVPEGSISKKFELN